MQKTRQLIEQVLQRSDNIAADDERIAIADQGVNYIVYSSLTEPGNQLQIVKELGDEGGKSMYSQMLMKGLFYKFCKSLGLVR